MLSGYYFCCSCSNFYVHWSIGWQAVAIASATVTTSVTVMVFAVAFVATNKTMMLSGLLQWLSVVTAQAIVAVVIEI
jgi:hypothetical protein